MTLPINLRVPIVIFAVLAIISLTDRRSNDCELTFTAVDGTVLESRAKTYLLQRSEELLLLGVREDGSDLTVLATRLIRQEPLPKSDRNLPIDHATTFLHADVNGYGYRFAFDDCAQVLAASNASGF